jgi:hypothetical protein
MTQEALDKFKDHYKKFFNSKWFKRCEWDWTLNYEPKVID